MQYYKKKSFTVLFRMYKLCTYYCIYNKWVINKLGTNPKLKPMKLTYVTSTFLDKYT